MVISHKYRFIFIAVPKTAGTSMHNYLLKHDPNCRYIYGNQPTGVERLQKHSTALQALCHFPRYYFSFCFVRNPWDRAASYHEMLKRQNDIRDFEHFVKGPPVRSQSYWCCNNKGDVMVDYIGKYENLNQDFVEVCDIVGLPKEGLGHWMSNHTRDYSNKFTKESIKAVANSCKWEIDKFDYKPPKKRS